MPYSKYTLEQFLTDPDFIQWVKSPNAETNAFWQAYISGHPYQSDVIQQARKIILLFEIRHHQVDPSQYLEMWENISKSVTDKSIRALQPESVSITAPSSKHWIYKVAASFIVMAIAVWFYRDYKRGDQLTISTGYGESRTLFLPDSTKVTLNANSSISYTENEFHSKNRNVSLEGQAFFTVSHTIDNQTFRVHTDELQVEVLGTRFDVNSRRGRTKVMLEEGKVRLEVDRKNSTSNSLVMKPGNLAEVSAKSKEIDVKDIDAESYLSWRNNLLEFNATPLLEIAQLIEDNYGYTVTFMDDSLMNRNFSGSSPGDDINELLNTLSRVFGIHVTVKGKEIVFEKIENYKQ